MVRRDVNTLVSEDGKDQEVNIIIIYYKARFLKWSSSGLHFFFFFYATDPEIKDHILNIKEAIYFHV